MTITIAKARKLIKNVASGLLAAEDNIKLIISEKAWEPLGFATFSDMWASELSHIELAKYLLPHIVYQMFDEGCTDENVADVVKGIGPKTAANIRRKKSNGVPPEFVIVREYARKSPPATPSTYHLQMGPEEFAEHRRIATKHGLVAEEVATAAIRSAFEKLGRRRARKAS